MFGKLVDMDVNKNSILHSLEVRKKDAYLEFIKTFPDPTISALMLRKYAQLSRRGYRPDSRIMENDIETVLIPYAKQEIYKKYGFQTMEGQGFSQLMDILAQNLTKNKTTTAETQTQGL